MFPREGVLISPHQTIRDSLPRHLRGWVGADVRRLHSFPRRDDRKPITWIFDQSLVTSSATELISAAPFSDASQRRKRENELTRGVSNAVPPAHERAETSQRDVCYLQGSQPREDLRRQDGAC